MTWEEQLQLLKANSLVFRLSKSRVFSLTGRDHLRYLHNRTTQDVKGTAIGESKGALILTPNGRTLGVFRFFRTSDGITLIVDDIAGEEESFRGDLLRFKVADDVQLTDLSETGVVYSLQGTALDRVLSKLQSELTLSSSGAISELSRFHGTVIPHSRGRFPGCDILLPRSAEAEFLGALTPLGVHLGDDDGLEALRILGRIPRYAAEITEKTLASDLPLEGLVSFTKGCYAGQEVVEMATSRGKPNRELVVLQYRGRIFPGDPILSAPEGKNVGVVTSVLAASTGEEELSGICLGFIKCEQPAELQLSTNAATLERTTETA